MAFRRLDCDDPVMLPSLLILLGLTSLIIGAEALVRGASWVAEALGIRPMIVGLTVVAIGTSAPELFVSLIAAQRGPEGAALVLGNIHGSNVANLALILGMAAVIQPIVSRDARLRFEVFWLMGASLLTLVPFFAGGSFTRVQGALMLAGLLVFLYTLIQRERRNRPARTTARPETNSTQWALHLVLLPAGIVALIYGGDWLVDGASQIAVRLGWSQGTIGASIVAVGTSVPELATTLIAARRGHPELALGNVVGSNIFNILFVLGITVLIQPLDAAWSAQGLRTVVALVAAFFVSICLLGPRRLGRPVGVALLLGYAGYLTAEVTQARGL